MVNLRRQVRVLIRRTMTTSCSAASGTGGAASEAAEAPLLKSFAALLDGAEASDAVDEETNARSLSVQGVAKLLMFDRAGALRASKGLTAPNARVPLHPQVGMVRRLASPETRLRLGRRVQRVQFSGWSGGFWMRVT